ncbi:MAG: hypothetical protein M3033_04530 [Acidobacteriota bacterium]|nr:hypothetical protein [Acidobacteriota bacterium]
MHKRQPTTIGILFVTVVLFTVSSLCQEAQTSKLQEEEATIVQKGKVTDEERVYSKIYEKEYDFFRDEKISQMRGTDRLVLEGSFPGSPNDLPVRAEIFFNKLACDADLIIRGMVKDKSSHLTEDETFVYTEHKIIVGEIIKNNEKALVEVGSEINVTRPGGVISLDGRIFRVTDKSYESLKTKGQYLLFLKFVPAANGYKSFNSSSDFSLADNKFNKLTKRILPKELDFVDSETSLVQLIRNSNMLGCKNVIGGGFSKFSSVK